ncbi:MAG: phosphatase [Bacteroidota bacterium]
MADVESSFSAIGGAFLIPAAELQARLATIKAYVFDWDGVFNSGFKGQEVHSPFSEADSMGTNMVRFAHWLRTGELPITAILTGALNPSAQIMAEREHFNLLAYRFLSKREGLEHLCREYGLQPSEIAFVFDDILDLVVSEQVGVRFQVQRHASPMFSDYVAKHNLADYVTGHTGGDHAVREVCELILGLNGQFEEAVEHRMAFSPTYTEYFTQRNNVPTALVDGRTA